MSLLSVEKNLQRFCLGLVVSMIVMNAIYANDQNYEQRQKIEQASNPNTPPETLVQLAKGTDLYILRYVATNPSTPPSAFIELSQSHRLEVLKLVALNKKTPPEVLIQLSHDGRWEVREKVARNTNTPQEVLSFLAKDSDWGVRVEVALNPKTITSTLLLLAEDPEKRVQQAAIYSLNNESTDHVSAIESIENKATTPEPNICVECDILEQKLRIVRARKKTFEEGIIALRKVQEELRSDANSATVFGNVYLILGAINMSFGLATSLCPIPSQWLRGLLSVSSGITTFISDGDAKDISLSTILGFMGSGVISDIKTYSEFLKQYPASVESIKKLKKDIVKTIQELSSTIASFAVEENDLVLSLSRGGCK